MDKITYLAELAEGLARWVPERERQDILRYYAEYFDEAGPDREGQVVAELGDPWALSCRLAVEGGYVTQEKADAWRPRQSRRKVWPFVLAGSLAAVAIVAVSVGMLASQVGRAVGRFVGGAVEQVAVVDQVQEGTGFVTIPKEPGVAYIDGEEMTGVIWSREDGYLDTFSGVDVDISFGNVAVTGGEDYTLAIQQEGDLGGYELKWEIKDGTLKIRDAKSGGAHIDFDGLFGKHSLDVVITVPDEVMEKVSVETGLGNVFLSQVRAESKIEAKTALGDVECYEVRAFQKLTLKSKLGDVFLGQDELWDGIDIELKSNLGQVEAHLNCREGECGYELDCDLGVVTVNGQERGGKAEQKGSSPYKLDAKSDLGDVCVNFYDSQWQ